MKGEESKRDRKKKKKREKETGEREREAPCVCIQHVPVCAFKMSPCVPATCPHVFFFHVGMLPVHTGTF